MSKTQYTYAVARIRALEVSLFSSSDMEQLLACKDEKACLRFLQEKGWGENDIRMDTETILSREREKIWEEIRQMRVDMSVFDVLSYPNWFHNLKAAIKMVYTGKENGRIFYEGTPIAPKDMVRIIRDRDYKALPKSMEKAAEEAMETLLHSADGQLCDIIIDRACMEAILEAGKASKEDVIRAYAQSSVAVSNIKIAVRSAKTGKTMAFMKRAMAPCDSLNVEKLSMAAMSGVDSVIEYLKENGYAQGAEALKDSPSSFERWCDREMMETLESQKMSAFSVGPLVAYVLARENEIKIVRMILTCKQNGVSDELIRERIREMYV